MDERQTGAQAKAMTSHVAASMSSRAMGERESDFTACVTSSQRRVFRIAYSILRNPADAEEVAQEVFLRAYRRFASLREPEKFSAWVNRIAFRLALNRQRARRRDLVRDTAWHSTYTESVPNGARNADDRVFLDRLRAEIERLPQMFREVLLLCAIEGMDSGHVARVLGIPEGTVRSRLHSARKQLLGALHQ
ncbi:MAG TPA: sigma-70 family RNA polymerase sigma factor [Vicinamibacterales bacterium]|jgi:RNA polymerase sigma-70 factor (ECF subfamily)|nr:sigma-70 family RNA polymerase sigma factor [Vicinamibacterales bacterium]